MFSNIKKVLENNTFEVVLINPINQNFKIINFSIVFPSIVRNPDAKKIEVDYLF